MSDEKRKVSRSNLVRQAAIGLAILAVLSCTILGSAVLTVREGTLISILRPAATPTLQPLVLLTPTRTPGGTSTLSPTPTWTTTGTPQAPTQTWTPLVVSPSATPAQAGAGTMTATPTVTASPTAAATATAPASPTASPAATSTALATPRPLATNTPRLTCQAPASWRIYVVRNGDTLTALAVQHGTSVAAIVDANCLATSTIYSGQRLYLPPIAVPPPPPPTRCVPRPLAGWVLYTVQNGDSLYSLAQRYQTTVLQIQQVNCLPGYVISAGQQLYLPSPLPSPTATWTLVPTVGTTATPTALIVPTMASTPTPADTPAPTSTMPPDTPTPAPTSTMPPDTPTPLPTSVPTTVVDTPTEVPATATPTTN